MSRDRPEATDLVRQARRFLEEHPRARVTGELLWNGNEGEWAFPVELTVDSKNPDLIPVKTNWYLVLDPRYPWGDITVYPAKKGGIQKTFPHQDHNGEGDEHVPWRSGDLCVRAPAFSLGRAGSDPDPKGEPTRILWYADRALEWLERASNNELTRLGDEFELPQWRANPLTVGFLEDPTTFSVWQNEACTLGTVELVALGEPAPYAARRFFDERGRVLVEPPWGRAIREAKKPQVGAWIRLPTCPLVEPYGAPMRWGELLAVMEGLGIAPSDILSAALNPLRDGVRRVLLVGFPVPRRFGDAPSLMHWQPLLLPELSHGSKPLRGFSANSKGYWLGDSVSVLSAKKSIAWLTGRNWSPAEIGTRGQLSEPVRRRTALIIGCGALGATIAELLVRGGLYKITLVDDDSVAAGNLVRHTLALADVGLSKAVQVAKRLNAISPHADVEAIVGRFPLLVAADTERCSQADFIIDCSGSDDVLQAMAETERTSATTYLSVAMGREAERLYVYGATARTFPLNDFRRCISPWLARDEAEFKTTDFPWEGVGCWHPVFPATPDRVWAFAAAAVHELDTWVREGRGPELVVIGTSGSASRLEGLAANA